MYYNVVISDELENDEFYSQLVFTFGNLDEAKKFMEYILDISNYSVQILKLKKGE